jgi:hypothetical protein
MRGRKPGKAKFDRVAYNRKYQAEMKLRRLNARLGDVIEPFAIDPTPCKPYVTGAVICQSFGCSKVLSLIEQLAGGKCTGCMNEIKIDINKILKHE